MDFSYSDLRGLNFDGATFTGVKFDQAALEGVSFRGAILRDCSFRGSWSKKYYKALRTVNFDGARMDKLTYAALKGFGVEPANVTRRVRRHESCKPHPSRSRSRDCRSPTASSHVLKGVDFAVASGSIFALLGSNGAGKTTVVRILTTLLKPDGGTASVNGFDVVSQPDDGSGSRSA